MNVLFVCSRNRWRSPTAEILFADTPNWCTASAGTATDAECRVDEALLEWADLVVAMEAKHRRLLTTMFPNIMPHKSIAVLRIPDHYKAMDPALIRLLTLKMARWLPS